MRLGAVAHRTCCDVYKSVRTNRRPSRLKEVAPLVYAPPVGSPASSFERRSAVNMRSSGLQRDPMMNRPAKAQVVHYSLFGKHDDCPTLHDPLHTQLPSRHTNSI